ncbi:MAG: adenylate/guanylate cyclase domain-containing protein [Bradymonadia bacterium]
MSEDLYRRALSALQGRVSKETLAALEHSLEQLAPAWTDVTVLCVDLRGFRTARRHFKDAEQVFAALNAHYFGPVISILVEQGGCIDRIIDDQVHAVFGAPRRLEAHVSAEQAVRAAQLIQSRLADLPLQLQQSLEVGVKGVACGLASGKALSGLVGQRPFCSWTLLGELTTLAGAIEDAAAEGQVLADASTLDVLGQTPPPDVEQRVVVVGRAHPADVYVLS